MTQDNAHLYVEKYSKNEKMMLLDFVKKEDFIYFWNNINHSNDQHLSTEQYNPTMLYVNNVNLRKKRLYKGNLLSINMDKLIRLCQSNEIRQQNHTNNEGSLPATVFMEFQDGQEFSELIDSSDCNVRHHVPKEYIHKLESSGKKIPEVFQNTKPQFEIHIWNVGQGNTNCIYDGKNISFFDFGAGFNNSTAALKEIISNHKNLLYSPIITSLIISHWDVDHYNLLTVVDDCFLHRIDNVFYPSEVIGLSAKQIADRIAQCCNCIAIDSPNRTLPNKCGISVINSGNNYKLFIGEKSKSKNRSGLLLAVYSKTATALLTADHTNYQVWDNMYAEIEPKLGELHIVVPHHGGKCGKESVRPGKLSGIAAVSVGKNSYKHPNKAVLKQYEGAGYRVICTDDCGKDIIIRMN